VSTLQDERDALAIEVQRLKSTLGGLVAKRKDLEQALASSEAAREKLIAQRAKLHQTIAALRDGRKCECEQ
jgi:chromosome segregation ATPase